LDTLLQDLCDGLRIDTALPTWSRSICSSWRRSILPGLLSVLAGLCTVLPLSWLLAILALSWLLAVLPLARLLTVLALLLPILSLLLTVLTLLLAVLSGRWSAV
jgi:hypothetical protein